MTRPNRVFRHNGLLGSIGMARKYLETVQKADTLTDLARVNIDLILQGLEELRREIKQYRRETEGSVSTIGEKK